MFAKLQLFLSELLFPLKYKKKELFKIIISPFAWFSVVIPLHYFSYRYFWHKSLFKQLITAIKSNDFEKVKFCTTHISPYQLLKKDNDGYTPLLLASEMASSQIIKALIAKTPLSAFWTSDLLQHRTPLHWIAEKGDIENAIYILGKVPKELLSIIDREGQTPLFIACKERNFALAKLLAQRSPIDALSTTDNFWEITPLCIACKEGDLATVKILIDKLPEEILTKPDDFWKKTPLHRACEGGHLEIVIALLEKLHSSAINLQDRSTLTPLQLAAKNNHWEIVKLIMSKTLHQNKSEIDPTPSPAQQIL